MIFTAVLTLCLALLRVFGEPLLREYSPDRSDALVRLATVALIVSLSLLVDRLMRRLYWAGYLKRRSGRETPKLVQDLVTVLFVAAGVAIGLWWQEGLTLTGIAATSLAVAAAIGVALQSDIQDVFSGLAMNYEDSCGIGDWVTIDSQDIKEPIFGCVTSMSWRSTFVTMENGCRVSVPNHLFTSNPVINHSRPVGAKRLTIEISIDNRVPADRVRDMLLGEIYKAVRRPGLLRTPDPDVLIARIDRDATVFALRFWYSPGGISPTTAKSFVQEAVQDVLLQNALPMPVTQVEMAEAPNISVSLGMAEVREGLSHSQLFSEALNDEQRELLATRSKAIELDAGTVLMRQGDLPTSMFIVLEGAVSITISHSPDKQEEVAVSATGDMVGEMSLMTGAARSATVTALTRIRVLEITKDVMEEVLRGSPELFDRISRLLAKRQMENQMASDRHADSKEVASDILAQMRKFFSRALKLGSSVTS